jgi:hypothetical protein
MDFMDGYILDVRIESAATSHLKALEVWRCEKCRRFFVDSGDGEPRETDGLPTGALP